MDVRIVSTGVYRPRKVVANDFFQERLGLDVKSPRKRGHASTAETSVMMGTAAVEDALAAAGKTAEEIDLLVCFTGMPDFEYPKDVNAIQQAVGLSQANCWSLDTACASFISGMKCAYSQLATGLHRRALVLNIMNWVGRGIDQSKDYSSIGDGAAAVLLEATEPGANGPGDEERHGFLGAKESTHGDYFDFIVLPSPFASDSKNLEHFSFSQDSKHARFLAAGCLPTARTLMEETGVSPGEIDWFIAHQPGERMIKLWAKALGLAPEKILHTFDECGNMSAANIPTTLHEYTRNQPRIQRGDRLLFFAPGAGLHVAAMLWRY